MALRFQGQTSNNSASTTCAVNCSGLQAGDVALLFVVAGGGGTNTITAADQSSNAMTTIPGLSDFNFNFGQSTVAIRQRICLGTESSFTATSNVSDFINADLRVYSGRNTSSLYTAVAATATNTGNNAPVIYQMTGLTGAGGDDVVQFVNNTYYSGTTPSFAPPSLYANAAIAFQATTFARITCSCDYVNFPGGFTAGSASTNNATLVSNVLTVSVASSGTIVVGMNVQGAGVANGVTITSLGTGTGGLGTYNCSSSATNVSAAEAMNFSNSGVLSEGALTGLSFGGFQLSLAQGAVGPPPVPPRGPMPRQIYVMP